MNKIARFMLPVVMLGSTAGGASAMVCGEHQMLVSLLDERYQERQRSLGVNSDGDLIEVYASDDGEWTLLATMPDGGACIVAEGKRRHGIPDRPAA